FGGLGGRALRAGDLIALGRSAGAAEPAGAPALADAAGAGAEGVGAARADAAGEITVRVILGPQDDHFAPEAIAAFLGEAYGLAPESDRVGCRLQGPRLPPRGGPGIAHHRVVPRCVAGAP